MRTDNRKKDLSEETKSEGSKPASMSRRALLKQAGVAMPAVLTLQSGAAMAASSVYIGTTTRDGSRDSSGNVYCMDVRNAEPVNEAGTTYRFVNTNYADVYVLPDGSYHDVKGNSKDNPGVLSDQFCSAGGSKFLNASGWPQYDLPAGMNGNGVLVSATALASVTAALDINFLP